MPNSPAFAVPTTAEEAAAAEVAVAVFYRHRVQAAVDVMTGPEAQAFADKVSELLAGSLPAGTSAADNLPKVAEWFTAVQAGLALDLVKLDAIIRPGGLVEAAA